MIGHHRKSRSIHVVFNFFFSQEKTTANASRSDWEYLVSAADNERLPKVSGLKALFLGLLGENPNLAYWRQQQFWFQTLDENTIKLELWK